MLGSNPKERIMDPSLASQAAEVALQVLTPILIIVGTYFAHRLVKVFEAKSGIDIPDRQEVKIDEWIEAGIHFAEEKSRSYIKEKANKLKGPEKLELAGDFVMAMIKKNGWDNWAKEAIVTKIEGSLGAHRANGGKPRLDGENSPDLPTPLPEVG
jgi:hypothetical protein